MEEARDGQRKGTRDRIRGMDAVKKVKPAEARSERLVTLQYSLNGVVMKIGSEGGQDHLLTVHDTIEKKREETGGHGPLQG